MGYMSQAARSLRGSVKAFIQQKQRILESKLYRISQEQKTIGTLKKVLQTPVKLKTIKDAEDHLSINYTSANLERPPTMMHAMHSLFLVAAYLCDQMIDPLMIHRSYQVRSKLPQFS